MKVMCLWPCVSSQNKLVTCILGVPISNYPMRISRMFTLVFFYVMENSVVSLVQTINDCDSVVI